jgi:flagellar hook protein FlgE
VLSDNISNSNTTAYKTARAEFSDIFASFTGIKDDGVIQGGNGAKISSVRSIFNSGEADFTARSLDVAIEGNGFFITGDATGSAASLSYTRAGNFQLDKEGYLVTGDGKYVLGTAGSTTTEAGATPTLTRLNLATIQNGATATTAIVLGGNLSSTLPIKTPAAAYPSMAALGQAASHIENIESYDSLGTRRDVTLAFFKTGAGVWTVNAYAEGSQVGGTAGVPVQIGSVTGLTFGPDGLLAAANKANAKLTATPAWSDGAAAGNFTIDLSQYTQYASGSALSSKTQNGAGVGQIKDYEIDKTGKVMASLSNGSFVQVGTLQMANFVNIDGMQRIGSNSFQPGVTAGAATIGTPGSRGLGITRGSSLERSTTDLSAEFVNLVVFQRGYQANSQLLSAANELIQQTLGLIR